MFQTLIRAGALALVALVTTPARAQNYDIVYDQLSGVTFSTTFAATTLIGTGAPAATGQYIEAADDFSLTVARDIEAVRIHQIGLETFPASKLLRVTFYAHDAQTNQPGPVVCVRAGIDPVLEVAPGDSPDKKRHALLVLPQPCRLAAGTYWISVQMDRVYDLGGVAFNWNGYLIGANTPPQLGRGVALRGVFPPYVGNCPVWNTLSRTACLGLSNNTDPVNMLFQLLATSLPGDPGGNGGPDDDAARVDTLSTASLIALASVLAVLGLFALAVTRRG